VEQARITQILRIAFRVLAAMTIAAFVPFATIAYAFLPVKIRELLAFYPEPYPWGTESYRADRQRILVGLVIDMVLYVFGSLSLVALASIASGAFSRRGQRWSWAIAALTGAAIAVHLRPTIGPNTDRSWVAMVVVIPVATSIVSCAGFVHALLRNSSD
jgi:hypothetical protein